MSRKGRSSRCSFECRLLYFLLALPKEVPRLLKTFHFKCMFEKEHDRHENFKAVKALRSGAYI
ncbi:hypothetical protein SAMN05660706_12010 [Desulfoscipio geothermicus DSM 3669]|uniref:Uncharacterized protein n=1 Tax=Desulfoscipio geothermicus DSM 3669 TaxID=1121426 RepID=A0A1I6DWW1_9FIRM|nr:hypothetical protein SAMN05660706_12010 [Desulfoscipio geothermicus DSM 3669]